MSAIQQISNSVPPRFGPYRIIEEVGVGGARPGFLELSTTAPVAR